MPVRPPPRSSAPRASRQEGVALFIALVVLLIITVLGISGLQTTTLQERMAAGSRDRDMAFQAAEAALARGEDFVESLGPGDLAQFGANASGLYVPPTAADEDDRWETVDWDDAGAVIAVDAGGGVSLAGVSAQPRYIVEYVTSLEADSASLNLANYGTTLGAPTEIFRITALGQGGSDRARVMLQSTYGKIL